MGTKARNYSEVTIKSLFALSMNKCALCETELILDDYTNLAEICHIEDANQGGRYNKDMSDEERADFKNLLLLCRNCHKITNNQELYPKERLVEIKQNHEAKARAINYIPNSEKSNKLLASFAYDYSLNGSEDWGIIESIVNYTIENTIQQNLTKEQIVKDEKFINTREKVRLNFPKAHIARFSELFQTTTARKLSIVSYLTHLTQKDSIKVDEFTEFIVTQYCKIKNSSSQYVRIDDIKYIDELANQLIPETRRNAPEYLSIARAMIILIFESCSIGLRTHKEIPKKTLFDD